MRCFDLPLETKTHTRNYTGSEVVTKRRKWVFLEHVPEVGCFSFRFSFVDLSNEFDPLTQWHVCPVGAVGIVKVVGVKQGMKHIRLVRAHVVTDVNVLSSLVLAGHVGAMGCSNTIIPEGWWRRFVRIRHSNNCTTRAGPDSLLYVDNGMAGKSVAQSRGS